MTTVRVATFNTEWRRSASQDARLIRERLAGSDVICLTEAQRDFFGAAGHVVAAPGQKANRTKVLLWSKAPWREIDEGEAGLLGYYLGATTDTDIGPIRLHGVVIPYRFSGVRYSEPKREAWELHQAHLNALDARLPARPDRSLVLGDFNQRIPRKFQPNHIFEQLEGAVLRRFTPATKGEADGMGKQSIDHICHSPDLTPLDRTWLSNVAPDGHKISDHFGVQVSYAARV